MTGDRFGTSTYSSELAEAVGLVVLEASQAEDTLAELMLISRGPDEIHTDWWKSGESLAKILEMLGDSELEPLIAEYRRLIPRRNDVVHSVWVESSLGVLQQLRGKPEKGSGEPKAGTLTRMTSDPLSPLRQLACDFRKLEAMASDAVSDYMGIPRTEDSGLPQRTAPVVFVNTRGWGKSAEPRS